ncbi:MAG: 1-acyl-sn-glycerol-3-phosphate acyltransferase [Flavobacteriales bacterium]
MNLMLNTSDLDDIRPFEGEEVKEALERISKDPRFFDVLEHLFPEVPREKEQETLLSDRSTYDFQRDFMHKGIRRILDQSSDGLSYEGFQYLDPEQPYLFIANHRDIFLDSGILEILLFEHGIDTTEITFGSNLMNDPLLYDVGKVNKMFTVYREGSGRGKYENSKRLSAYIRHAITEKRNSVWIAQRDGRTKNGDDRTHPAVLKMLCSSGSQDDLEENLRELDIVPLTISYEFEPCDRYKVKELYHSEYLGRPYTKEKGEDLKQIVEGVTGQKGHVHMAVGMPLSEEIPAIMGSGRYGEKIQELASMIDNSIHDNFKLWPSNHLAYDQLFGTEKYAGQYEGADKERFEDRKEEVLSGLEGDRKVLLDYFLRIYANPVVNKERL